MDTDRDPGPQQQGFFKQGSGWGWGWGPQVEGNSWNWAGHWEPGKECRVGYEGDRCETHLSFQARKTLPSGVHLLDNELEWLRLVSLFHQ